MQLSVGEWDAVLQTAKILKVAYEPTEQAVPNGDTLDKATGHRLAHAVVIAARLIMHEIEAALDRARAEHGERLSSDTTLEIEGLHTDDLTGLMTLFLENSEDIRRRVSTEDVLGSDAGGEYRAAHLRHEIVSRSLDHLQEQLDKILKRLGVADRG